MKEMIICVVLVFVGVVRGNAQIIGQIEEELQQLAAYEVYLKDAEKGYSIVENGIHTVGEIKNGTFGLHSAFFSSLRAINPSVKSDAEVAEIILLQISIVESFQQAIQYFKQSGGLHSDELNYIASVYSAVVNDGLEDINALLSLTTAGSYSMNDGERLDQIDALYKDMSDKYTFTQAFVGQGSSLDRSRAAELNDIGEVGALYELK